jgi:hypothetical protein
MRVPQVSILRPGFIRDSLTFDKYDWRIRDFFLLPHLKREMWGTRFHVY